MTSFLLGGLSYIYNSIVKAWPNVSPLKRPREDSEEEEEDDDNSYCHRLSKKPRWISPNTSNHGMAGNGCKREPSSSEVQLDDVSSQESFADLSEEDTELVDLESDDMESSGKIPLLSNIPVNPKNQIKVSADAHAHPSCNNRRLPSNYAHQSIYQQTSSGSSSDHGKIPLLSSIPVNPENQIKVSADAHAQPSCNNRRQPCNNAHQNIYQQTRSRSFYDHGLTAPGELFRVDDEMMYSKLVGEYLKSPTRSSSKGSLLQTPTKSPLSTDLGAERRKLHSHGVECKDLSQEDKVPPRFIINAKPYKPPGSSDEEIKIFEQQIPVPIVNSLEKKLSANPLVHPRWITDTRRKYEEKEREIMKQVKEEQLKLEFDARCNLENMSERLDVQVWNRLNLPVVVVWDDAAQLPELTREMKEVINAALRENPPTEVLVEGFGQKIRRYDIQTLNNLNWINDEIINFYMNLLMERGKSGRYMSIYAFNTFFCPKLLSQGYSSLRRWTKKVDIFIHDLILVPVHLDTHWCMAVMDFRDRTIRYYDSMGSENTRCLRALLHYLAEECFDKNKVHFDADSWKLENVADVPHQMNGCDCGVFSCVVAEYLSRNATLTFHQRDMAYFRQKIVYEIITKRLLM